MVELINETHRYPSPEGLGRALERLMGEYGLADVELTLVLCDDAQIREMNRLHRNIDAATDVLSYPTHEPDDTGLPTVNHLGDIVISVETAAEQASARGHSLERELKVLAAHGLMHLRGHDHESEEAWLPFRQAQARILEL